MEAQVWTLIGLLGGALLTLIGAYFHIGSRIDSLGTDLRAEIRGLRQEMTGRLDGIEQRLTDHIARHSSRT